MKIRLKMSKTILFFVLLIGIITSFSLVPVFAENNNTNGNVNTVMNTSNMTSTQNEFNSIFSFTPISDTECDVRLADKTATRAIVPEKVELNGNEYTVTVIAANGFTSATKLEMVRLPKSVKTIGSNAFTNCKALTSLTLPAVETIGANAFAMTNMDYLIIPTTVTSVASTILRGANTQVYVRSALGDGDTAPEGWVSNWNGNNKNQSVEFDSSFVPDVKYEFVSSEVATFALGDDVDLRNGGYYVTGFQEFCTVDTDDYKEVYIPATYTGEDGIEYPIIGIDGYAFYFNDIEKVTIGYSELPIRLATECFYGLNGSLITINREVELLSEDWDGSEAISESVFACSTVLTIILPNSLQVIGNNMFDGCENLRDIHFIEPNGTLSQLAETNISISLPSTRQVDLPSSISYIGNNAFALTRNILDLYIPCSVEFVGSNIISGWTSNQTVYVDLVADDPIFENWNEYWALGSGQDDTANVVYKLSDTSYQITYNVGKEYHNNADSYISSEGLTLLPAQMTGYTFEGWYLDENFTKPIENIAIGTTGNLTLYAKLVGNQYTIKYDRNQPAQASNPVAGDMEQSTHTYGTTSKIRDNQFTLKGWTFKGWVDSEGKEYQDGEEVTTAVTSGNLILFAQWSQNSYNLKYVGNRPNDASSAISPNKEIVETYSYEEEFNIKGAIYSVTGWTFKGWNTDPYGNGTSYAMGSKKQSLTEAETITLYGQWEVNTYIIEYNSNGGSGSLSFTRLTYEEGYTIPSNPFTYVGRHFTGWKDGSGNPYVVGQVVFKLKSGNNENITLYAQWEINTYTINYNANGGSGFLSSTTHKYGEEFYLPKDGVTLAGKHIVSWTTNSNGTGNKYLVQTPVSNLRTGNNESITLYAQWEWNDYKICYNSNYPQNASAKTDDETKTILYKVNTPATFDKDSFSLTGWTLTGWKDGSGTYYDAGEDIDLNCDDGFTLNLYAQWQANTYTIVYNANLPMANVTRTDSLPSTTTHTYDTASKINDYYTLVSWEMTGWFYNGEKYDEGVNVSTLCSTNNGQVTLVAQWKEKENVMDCQNSNSIYEIVSINQLKGISQGAYSYKLMRDIKIDDNWQAIQTFNGTLDLAGHTITYKHDSLGSNLNYGFIINNTGTIKNGYFKPYIVQSSVDDTQENEVYIGGVVAENNGTITNIEVISSLGKGNDSMTSDKTETDINARSVKSIIGGIAGKNYGTILDCTNKASLGGSYFIGGIAGENKKEQEGNAIIDNCTNEGEIWYCLLVDGKKCVGGIAGVNYANAVIKNCNNFGKIVFAYRTTTNAANEVYMANIAGWGHTSATIENCSGLSNPIENKVTGLTTIQLSYIKTNGDNIGKETYEPDPNHIHSYDCVPALTGHKGTCSCGNTITSAHIIRASDRNKATAPCIECKAIVNLKTGFYIVEPGFLCLSENGNNLLPMEVIALVDENYESNFLEQC